MRFVDAWAKEIWPVIQADYERLLKMRPSKQDEFAVGTHYGSKVLEVIARKGEVRNVSCNLTWMSIVYKCQRLRIMMCQ